MYYCHHGMALAKPTILFSHKSWKIWPYTLYMVRKGQFGHVWIPLFQCPRYIQQTNTLFDFCRMWICCNKLLQQLNILYKHELILFFSCNWGLRRWTLWWCGNRPRWRPWTSQSWWWKNRNNPRSHISSHSYPVFYSVSL